MAKSPKINKSDVKDLDLTLNPLRIEEAAQLSCHCKCYSCKGAHP